MPVQWGWGANFVPDHHRKFCVQAQILEEDPPQTPITTIKQTFDLTSLWAEGLVRPGPRDILGQLTLLDRQIWCFSLAASVPWLSRGRPNLGCSLAPAPSLALPLPFPTPDLPLPYPCPIPALPFSLPYPRPSRLQVELRLSLSLG